MVLLFGHPYVWSSANLTTFGAVWKGIKNIKIVVKKKIVSHCGIHAVLSVSIAGFSRMRHTFKKIKINLTDSSPVAFLTFTQVCASCVRKKLRYCVEKRTLKQVRQRGFFTPFAASYDIPTPNTRITKRNSGHRNSTHNLQLCPNGERVWFACRGMLAWNRFYPENWYSATTITTRTCRLFPRNESKYECIRMSEYEFK